MSKQKERPIVWRLVKACGRRRIAVKLGIGESAVGQWVSRNKMPDHYVIEVCRLSNGAFQPHQISPEVFDEGVLV